MKIGKKSPIKSALKLKLRLGNVGYPVKVLPQCVVDLFFGWWFGNSCAAHDVRYTVGGGVFKKPAADWTFFIDLLASVRIVKWCYKLPALVVAIVFFITVLFAGWFRFNYR